MIRLLILIVVGFSSLPIFAEAVSNSKLAYVYNENSINFVSSKQINAIEFPVPIVQVNSPPHQLVNIFSGNNRSLSYVNNNKTMLFYLSTEIDDIQFMVTLKNGRVLSLHFKGDSSPGRIIHIPISMAGSNLADKEGYQEKLNVYVGYDLKIKELMRMAFSDIDLLYGWLVEKESTINPYKNIVMKKYKEFNNKNYKLIKIEFCSNSKNILRIEPKKYFGVNKILAATLNRKNLYPFECAKLITLSVNSYNHAI